MASAGDVDVTLFCVCCFCLEGPFAYFFIFLGGKKSYDFL
jgi:hypothetical protein